MSQSFTELEPSLDEHEFRSYDAGPLPAASSSLDVNIAPWMQEDPESPPTPPPKSQRGGFIPHKPSFSTFSRSQRPSTVSSLGIPMPTRPSRGSDSISVADSAASSSQYEQISPQQDQPRKSKASFLRGLIPKKSSSQLKGQPSGSSLSSIPPVPSTSTISSPRPRIRKNTQSNPISVEKPEYTIDLNFENMDEIMDLSAINSDPPARSPGFSGNASDSFSDASNRHPSSANGNAVFINPFLPSTAKNKPPEVRRDISPRTQPDPQTILFGQSPDTNSLDELNMQPKWSAPESWAVVDESSPPDDPQYSSSEESDGARPQEQQQERKPLPKSRHKTADRKDSSSSSSRRGALSNKMYRVKIWRANGSYHVASIGLAVTVGSLVPVLNNKLLLDSERETHKLYLKERGRERVLAQTEKPADIVRRRLEQAGYDTSDGIDTLGAEDITFLLKFVYKTQLLGPTDEDLNLEKFDFVDLTGRSLQTIPIVLHTKAEQIVSLYLSQNPMLEIPLDFIQSCTALRVLHLNNMAMKKVPQNVRHSTSLHRLDVSCNRIVDLDDAGLDRIPDLIWLKVMNNRMEKLPWYFPRLQALKFLNISNNKFQKLPAVVAKMASLVDLDISFNGINELPAELGQLVNLERLIIVGNDVSRFPDACSRLVSLRILDCRRNKITDLSTVCQLPKLATIRAEHNAVSKMDLTLGPCLTLLEVSRNDVTQLALVPVAVGSYALTTLDISYAKLSSLDGLALSQLSSLQHLNISRNSFKIIPDSLGDLVHLTQLLCSDNQLNALPATLGNLSNLEKLDAHNNSLTDMPISLWNCSKLKSLNLTSNLIGNWHDPPTIIPTAITANAYQESIVGRVLQTVPERKSSATGSIRSNIGLLPPLAHSLERLYLGENRLTDDVLNPLMIFKELKILNLSFNEIQDMPRSFFRNLTKLEEVYLSGNKLSSLPTEDLHRLTKLSVLFLNGNRLQTLPQEMGKVKSLTVLDVGSNVLRYNTNNWEFDWNWNFNQNLKYLNLSGNQRLEIKSDNVANHKMHPTHEQNQRQVLSDFSGLVQLRMLGLMDVMITFANVPDENDDRRIRTSNSVVNQMAYGIADSMGKNESLTMLDLVQPEFRGRKNEAVFAMFGRAQRFGSSNRLTKFLHDNFLSVFVAQLADLDKARGKEKEPTVSASPNSAVQDALRRSFLKLNMFLHDELRAYSTRKMSQGSASTAGTTPMDASALRSGASGIVLYFVDNTLHIANAGNVLAVLSRQGAAMLVSTKHDPFDREETGRIRGAEGWVSPKGFVNDEIDISRSFGFFHLLPVVNARPDVRVVELTDLDEFVIVANRGLWDYISYQTAVDIARSERNNPMLAAQKLRDFAVSYGADGSTMIMIISVADLFFKRAPVVDSVMDVSIAKKEPKPDDTNDRTLNRLPLPIPPPTGHIALAFTDIVNSTYLWEVNRGMPTAMRLHNHLLRRQLRYCGGYEVKTEGDAFMCSFPTALAAVWWCMACQIALLNEPWPLDILECEDGKEVYDVDGNLIKRGLSVRMGVHCGFPTSCEPDPVTHRMDYFGTMVNRSARINSGGGGQIMCSLDVVREINARILETEPPTEWSADQPTKAIDAIRRMGIKVLALGTMKLKGVEAPEKLNVIYPAELLSRKDINATTGNPAASRVRHSVQQMHQLGLLCLRLEALSVSRVFVPTGDPRGTTDEDMEDTSVSPYMHGDPALLLPAIERASDVEIQALLESLSIRIDNTITSLCQRLGVPSVGANVSAALASLREDASLDERTLRQVMLALGL